MERKLRRNQNTLTIIGFGVILFGIWSMIKILLQYTLDQSQFQEMVHSLKTSINGESGMMVTEKFIVFFILITTAIMMFTTVCFRLYIGISAIREGLGRKRGKGYFYLILAAILVIINGASVFGTIANFTDFSGNYNTFFDKVSALVTDLTSLITVIEMINASIKVKILTRKLNN